MMITNSKLPHPSSIKCLVSDAEYLDTISKKLEEEKVQSYAGSKIARSSRSYKSVILNTWNNG